jgi:hypothetical protein
MASHRAGQAHAERLHRVIEGFDGRPRDELLNETLFTSLAQLALPLDAGGSTTMAHGRILGADGRHPPSSPSPSIRAGSWRCAMPRVPRQVPAFLTAQQGKSNGLGRTENWIKLGATSIMAREPQGVKGHRFPLYPAEHRGFKVEGWRVRQLALEQPLRGLVVRFTNRLEVSLPIEYYLMIISNVVN